MSSVGRNGDVARIVLCSGAERGEKRKPTILHGPWRWSSVLPRAGTLDLAVRIMGDELSKTLGVPVILTNKGGAGGRSGYGVCGPAKPEGYTVLAAPIGVFNILPFLTPDLHYKLSDFIPLCKYANSPNVILVKKDSPYKTFKDLIAGAKKEPGKAHLRHSRHGHGGPFLPRNHQYPGWSRYRPSAL